jgi:probable HAF family extracellular repeat protein
MAQGSAFGAPIYYLTDLGTLGGSVSFGTALNDNGEAVGYATLPGGQNRAFLYQEGPGMQNIGTTGSGESRAFDINNAGEIVGQTGNQAFRYSGGTMTNIDGANLGSANGLNESGEAVGTRAIPGANRAVRWDSENTASEPYPLSNLTGTAINNSNQFVGTLGTTNGYYSNNGVGIPQNLGTLLPTDINDNRLITGSIGDTAVVYNLDLNTTTMIPKLGAISELARALGLNGSGAVVGESGNKGFLFTQGEGILSLNSLLHSSAFGWDVLSAADINNNGWIVGTARFNGGPQHAVMLAPSNPSDFNGDRVVDADDLALWASSFGSVEFLAADADEDGDVDGADFLLWQQALTPSSTTAAGVPEPSALMHVLAAAAFVARCPGCSKYSRKGAKTQKQKA